MGRVRVLLATRNAHKAAEIRAILSPGLEIKTMNDFPGAPAVVEDAPSFAANAAKKAAEEHLKNAKSKDWHF